MGDELHVSDLGENEPFATRGEFDAVLPLRVGERVIPPPTPEAWVSWVLSRFQATEEGVHRLLQTADDILHNEGVDLSEGRAKGGFHGGQSVLLIIIQNSFLPFFPGDLAFCQQRIPEPAQLFQLLSEQSLLPFGRVEAVREGL
jgi:hypothetical protein